MNKPRTPAPYRDLSTLLRDAGAVDRDGAETEQTRARVVRALATFERSGKSRVQAERVERQFAIITRCDLGGQLHKVVASDLGISMRTFYRERGEAFERLRLTLESEGTRAAVPAPPPSATGARLERARLLDAQGRSREAIARLEELAAQELEPVLAAVVGARLSALWIRLGEGDQGAEALTRAKRAAALLGNGAPHAVAEAEIGLVEVTRLRAVGRYAAAAALATKISTTLHLRSSHLTPSGADAVRAARVLAVESYLEGGAAAQALDFAGNARELLLADDACPTDVRLDLALGFADAQLIVDGDCTSALRAATEAYATATAERLHRHAIRALRLIALVYGTLGDREVGAGYIRTAQEMVAPSLSGDEARRAAFDVAAACIDLDDVTTAQRALDAVSGGHASEGAVGVLRRVREAEVLTAQRRFRDGLTRAREAARLASALDSRRYLGEATLVLAKALHGCDEHRAARGAAVEAAALLTGATWPSRATSALDLAGRRDVGLRMRLARHHLPPLQHLNAS
jgi:tetratricopeptide (TPR) repeat protein